MKTIGLIGGMSWESSLHYYRLINQQVKQQLGGLHSARVILNSLDFAPIEQLQREQNWDAMALILVDMAESLQKAGADCVLICTNTMHKVAVQVADAVSIPLLHIADVTANAIKQQGLQSIALLGTAYTMEQDFIKQRLASVGLKVVIPDETQRKLVHKVIYEELCQGEIKTESRKAYVDIIESLQQQGAQGVILGCTEIGLLIEPQHVSMPLFDTTAIHAQAAVNFALVD
ncbi:aspartate/glutamate racemase family protein [Neptunicella marina]|uniref:Aspartate/glutamate racemase family protein n=1 Tax=Neptunicella marina TaxID=2125989 RepID=A0A8J6IUQ5_9ALTE|nr:aspartate/glutamate racemase family protein [Neptunicella marina]MBC3767056.1 aspartate/glutamate racemase family protein [Neptunicella marina]